MRVQCIKCCYGLCRLLGSTESSACDYGEGWTFQAERVCTLGTKRLCRLSTLGELWWRVVTIALCVHGSVTGWEAGRERVKGLAG